MFFVTGCNEKDGRPSLLEMKVHQNKQPDGSHRVTLEWSVEYNIDVVESLDFFRILVTSESYRDKFFDNFAMHMIMYVV